MKELKISMFVVITLLLVGNTSCQRVFGKRSWLSGTMFCKVDGKRWKATVSTINTTDLDDNFFALDGNGGKGSFSISFRNYTGPGVYVLSNSSSITSYGTGLFVPSESYVEKMGLDNPENYPIYGFINSKTDFTVEITEDNEDVLEGKFFGQLYDIDDNIYITVTDGEFSHNKRSSDED
ncbi:MAG: hypothetical protein ACPGLV_13435 [Bacteroidia bacterium]